jgi:hypothetical protein
MQTCVKRDLSTHRTIVFIVSHARFNGKVSCLSRSNCLPKTLIGQFSTSTTTTAAADSQAKAISGGKLFNFLFPPPLRPFKGESKKFRDRIDSNFTSEKLRNYPLA